MKNKPENVIMTEGDPKKIIFRFSQPLIFANLFQQLYNTMDTIIVGKINGDEALAAVGVSFAVTMVMIAVATGTGIGTSVLIAKYCGAGNKSKVKTGISTVLIFSLMVAALIAVLGVVLSMPLLRLLKTPQNIINDAADYLRIYSLGMPFMFLYNVQASVFSALGNSKTPFHLLVMSSLLNIGLDLLFVGGFSMGVSGAAWATFIAQGVSAVISFLLLTDKVYIKDHERAEFSFFSGAVLKEMSSYAAVGDTAVSGVGGNVNSAVCRQSLWLGRACRVHGGFKDRLLCDNAVHSLWKCGIHLHSTKSWGRQKRAYQRGLQGERAVMRRHSGDRICSDNASQAAILWLFYGLVKLLSFRHRNRHGLHDRPCVLLYNNGNKFKLQRNVKGAWVFEAVFIRKHNKSHVPNYFHLRSSIGHRRIGSMAVNAGRLGSEFYLRESGV